MGYYILIESFNGVPSGIKFVYPGYSYDLNFKDINEKREYRENIIRLWDLLGADEKFFEEISEDRFYNNKK